MIWPNNDASSLSLIWHREVRAHQFSPVTSNLCHRLLQFTIKNEMEQTTTKKQIFWKKTLQSWWLTVQFACRWLQKITDNEMPRAKERKTLMWAYQNKTERHDILAVCFFWRLPRILFHLLPQMWRNHLSFLFCDRFFFPPADVLLFCVIRP